MAGIKRPKPLKTFDPGTPGSLANKASVGNRVYNGVSPSTTSGHRNPKGFNERDTIAKTKRELLMRQIRNRGKA